MCWSHSVVDVPLQPLDARSLLAARAVLQTANQREKSIASSTPPSSLDLEWEHEGMFWVLFSPQCHAVCWHSALIDKGWWTFSLFGTKLTYNVSTSKKWHTLFLLLLYFVVSLTLRWLMSYIYGAPILDVSRSHTTTQHSR